MEKKYQRVFRGQRHTGSKTIPKSAANTLASKIRHLGRNVRVIPTATGTRLYVSKQVRPYHRGVKGEGGNQSKDPLGDLTIDPFANILTSSRNQRTDIVPVGPNRGKVLNSIYNAMADEELEYMEYSDVMQKAMEENDLTYSELQDSDELQKILSGFTTEELNDAFKSGVSEMQYRYAQEYLGNTYMPLLDSAIGWADIDNYGNKNKKFSREEIMDIASKSNIQTKEYQEMFEESISQKSPGRFTDLRVSNSEYFGKAGIYEWLERNQIVIPFEIVKQVDREGNEKPVLFRMDQAAIQRMTKQYRGARAGESGTMGPEVDFLSRLGGELSAYDADYYGGLNAVDDPFTFFDYMEIEHDQDDYVLESYTDSEDDQGYVVIKSVLGVVGPDKYGGPEFKGTYEYQRGDEAIGRLFPSSASFFPETYRDPLLGLRGLIWRDNIILNQKTDIATIQESIGVPINTGISEIRKKIMNDGYTGDPMAVLAYLTSGGIAKLEEDDLDALVDFNVREKYGDPKKLFPSIKKASLGDKVAKERLNDKNDGNWVSGWEYGTPLYPEYMLLQDELDAEQGILWDEGINRQLLAESGSKYYRASNRERRIARREREHEKVLSAIESDGGAATAARISKLNDNRRVERWGGMTTKAVANRLGELRRQGRVIRVDKISKNGIKYKDEFPNWVIAPGRRYSKTRGLE